MQRSRSVSTYSMLIIIYGAYNLISVGNFKQFALLFKPLPNHLITAIYAFTIIYGVCGVYCGAKLLRLENWARKVIIFLTAISVISGFFLNRIGMKNFKDFLSLPEFHIAPSMIESMYSYAVVLTALVSIFELSVIWFFTRSNVIRQFNPRG